MGEPVLRKIDNVMLRAADLDQARRFYGEALGHRLLWRSEDAIAFALPDTDAELVVHRSLGPEVDLLVHDVDEAWRLMLAAGATGVEAPFDIAIGRCAVVQDPLGNRLVILDQRTGRLAVDEEGRVTGVNPRE